MVIPHWSGPSQGQVKQQVLESPAVQQTIQLADCGSITIHAGFPVELTVSTDQSVQDGGSTLKFRQI